MALNSSLLQVCSISNVVQRPVFRGEQNAYSDRTFAQLKRMSCIFTGK